MDWSKTFSGVAGFFQSTVVGNILGFVSIFIGLYAIYVTLRRGSALCFGVRGVRLLGWQYSSFPAEVTVHYKGQDIPRLTRSTFVLWNGGKSTIRGGDIVDADRLRVEVDAPARILSAEVIRSSRSVIDASCPIQPSSLQVDLCFKFLTPTTAL
jgi:hypothetical protein